MASVVHALSDHDRKVQFIHLLVGVPLYHVVACLAFIPYFFTWTGVASALLGYFFIAILGINIGYHRLLAHRGVSCSKGWERFFAALGVLNLQFGPAYWVGLHRRHHHLTDKSGDPHSPRWGFWKSHLFFIFPITDDTDPIRVTNRYAKDLLADPFYAWFEKREFWHWATVLLWPVYFIVGYAIGAVVGESSSEAVRMGWSVLVWGVFVRTVIVWHITFSVNSIAHLWGTRDFDTPDDSRNNAVLGFLAWGEGWHNNHHAFPRSARHGHRWWQLDISWLVIRLLAALKILTIHDTGPSAAAEQALRQRLVAAAMRK